jgi:hypothetical protein
MAAILTPHGQLMSMEEIRQCPLQGKLTSYHGRTEAVRSESREWPTVIVVTREALPSDAERLVLRMARV